jgi:hypothetical protein
MLKAFGSAAATTARKFGVRMKGLGNLAHEKAGRAAKTLGRHKKKAAAAGGAAGAGAVAAGGYAYSRRRGKKK